MSLYNVSGSENRGMGYQGASFKSLNLASIFLGILFALSTIGYYVITSVGLFFPTQVDGLIVGLRFAVVAISVATLVFALFSKPRLFSVVGFLFLFIYFIRMSESRFEVPDMNSDMFFFGVVVVLPSLFASASALNWNDKFTAMLVAIVGGLGCGILAWAHTANIAEALSTFEQAGGRLSFSKLDTISATNFGAFTILAAACARDRLSKPLLFLIIGIGAWIMYSASARGPYLSLGVALVFLFTMQKNWRLLTLSFIGVVSLSLVVDLSQFLNRLRVVDIANDTTASLRVLAMNEGWEIFLTNPILGRNYLLPDAGMYPHNFIVEVGMSLGILGYILAFSMGFFAVKAGGKLIEAKSYFLPAAVLYWSVAIQFSGAIVYNGQFWVCIFILLGAGIYKQSDSILKTKNGPISGRQLIRNKMS